MPDWKCGMEYILRIINVNNRTFHTKWIARYKDMSNGGRYLVIYLECSLSSIIWKRIYNSFNMSILD